MMHLFLNDFVVLKWYLLFNHAMFRAFSFIFIELFMIYFMRIYFEIYLFYTLVTPEDLKSSPEDLKSSLIPAKLNV